MGCEHTIFTAAEVLRITGVEYHTLNYWAKIGVVKPAIRDAHGSGSRRVYDFGDLVSIRIAMKLRHAGIGGKALRNIIATLRSAGFESPAQIVMRVADGEVVVTLRSGESMSAYKNPGQLVFDFSFDYDEALKEVTDDLWRGQADLEPVSKPKEPLTKKPIIRAGGTRRKTSVAA